MTGVLAPRRGLYVLTDANLPGGDRLHTAVEAAIRGGAVMIQYRDKLSSAKQRHRQATQLLDVCQSHGVPLLINDDIELACAIGADGVHIGKDDPAIGAARTALGAGAIIGVSCYDSLQRAREASAAGADYIAFGSFFRSAVKPDAVRAAPGLLRQARNELDLPIVAIGGITADNGAQLLRAGADMLAVITDVIGADDAQAAARRYAALFDVDPAP